MPVDNPQASDSLDQSQKDRLIHVLSVSLNFVKRVHLFVVNVRDFYVMQRNKR